MASSPRNVHPTRPSDQALWLVKSTMKRVGVGTQARRLVTALARKTYSRTLRAVPCREELPAVLNVRQLTGTAVEIGVAKGDFSEYILEHWAGKRLISVDPWVEMDPGEYLDTCNISQESMEDSYETTKLRLSRFQGRSEIWRLTSTEASGRMSPGSVDFVYIDARHSYEGVREDLEAWFPLLRRGAIMAGHDYNDGVFAQGVHGVRSAVDEFFGRRAIPVRHTYADVPRMSWLVEVPG